MKATRGRQLADIALAISLALLALTLVLPVLKLPGVENRVIAGFPGGGRSYLLEFYDVPPIDAGTAVNVTFAGFNPGSLQFSLSPLQGDVLLPALYYGTAGAEGRYSFEVTPNVTAPLRLLVVSYNGTGYKVQISSIWSPFYDLRVYTSPAVFLVLASGFASYYYRQMVPRQRAEESVEKELEGDSYRDAAKNRAGQLEVRRDVKKPYM